MRNPAVVGLGILISLAIAYASYELNSELGRWAVAPGPPGDEPIEHLATPEMKEAGRGMILRPAPDFAKEATDGSRYALHDLLRKGPVVLTFIKIGCPCSVAAQPYFNRLKRAHHAATVLGVIDGDLSQAKAWSAKLQAEYPLLFDPDLGLVRSYEVQNSAYCVVIDAPGRILRYWPGYSTGMLRELDSLMGELTRAATSPIDLADAPAELYTGCPYPL